MKKQREQQWWRRNLGLKFMSVGLAFAVWLYVNSQGQITVNFAVPIEPVGLSPDLVLVDINAETADVRITARENTLALITTHHIHAYLDLSQSTPGEQWITLGSPDIEVSRLVDITGVTPRQVRVRIEPRETRAVRLVADITGKPAAGKKIAGITVAPEEVTLTGAKSAFKGLSRLRTQPVDVTGIHQSQRREVRLDLGGRDLEVTEELHAYVTITLEDKP